MGIIAFDEHFPFRVRKWIGLRRGHRTVGQQTQPDNQLPPD
jgi:hypothetical protein